MSDQPAPQRVVVPFTGQTIGEGFNSNTVERVGTALDVGSVGEDPVAPGQDAVFKFQMVTSQSSLEKALNIGAEIDARYALFSAGGKFDFAEQSAINSSSTYIIASGTVTNALRSGSGLTPNATAQRLIDAGDTDGFTRAFGDRYTQALHTGGELYALVRVTSSNTDHQQQISASLHAELNGLVAAVSFSASLEQSEKDSNSHTEIDVQVSQTGGVGDQIQIPGSDANSIRQRMNAFAQAAHANAAAYQAEMLTYDTLALPFPPPQDLEDKKEVLADCLAQRQRYWSAISDLTFAQSQDAKLIFENLPSDTDLAALETQFRATLNDLMDHARKVSSGAVAPSLFVADPAPVLPVFKRRLSGSFATWWTRAKDHDPTLLRDDTLLIADIGRAVTPKLSVPLDQAPPQAVEAAADTLTDLLINGGIDHLEFPRVTTLTNLPKMISAPLRSVEAIGTNLTGLAGLESFSRLQSARISDGTLSDLSALTSVAGLEALDISINVVTDLTPLRTMTALTSLSAERNQIVDLTPLAALTELTELDLTRNHVEDLTPLAGLNKLSSLGVAGNAISVLPSMKGLTALTNLFLDVNNFSSPPGDNPMIDARGLAESPTLNSLLASADRLHLTVANNDGSPVVSGIATRVGTSTRFDLVSDTDGTHQELRLQGAFSWHDPNLFQVPVVATALRFPGEKAGVACSQSTDPTHTLTIAELVALLLPQPPDSFNIGAFTTRDIDSGMPAFLVAVAPAPTA